MIKNYLLKRQNLGVAMMASLLVLGSSSLKAQTFTENNGSLTIQAENLNLKSQWRKESSVSGFRGSGYIVWKGDDYFKEPGPSSNLLSASIKINTPGKYRFHWRSKVGKGDQSTEHNDTWLKFPNSNGFYGEKDGEKKYPKGSGKTPNPEGASADGFMKVFLNRTTNWTETAVTSDFEDFPIFVEFNSAGTYTMQISPRSDFHLIDEIKLNRIGGSNNPDGGTTIKGFNGRLAYSADGDEHDTDDWLASSWSLALLRAAGLDRKLVFFEYNNHVWGTTGNWDEIQDNNIKGVLSRWGGFEDTDFYNYETQGNAAKNKLRDQINASTSNNPLFIIAAGPLETIGRAVDAAQSGKLQYVTIVSHSDWNNEHASESHGSKYTIAYLQNKGCKYKRVNDMNGNENEGYTDFGLKRNTSVMENRLKNHPDDRINWLWTARKMPEYEVPRFQRGKYDYSDAGMTWWLITGANGGGDERVTPKKTMDLLQKFIDENPSTCNVTLNGIDDFDNITVNGFAPTYRDNERKAIAVNSVEYPDEWAAANTRFTGSTGTYDITLTTLTEIDGESSYRLRVGSTLVGTYKNPESNTDYSPRNKKWTAVAVKNGDVIQVECLANTNGKIPEGNGTAYARGRWSQVKLECTTEQPNKAPSVTLTSPSNNAFFEVGQEISLTADASDSDGTVTRVEFHVNDQLHAGDPGVPYARTYTPTAFGVVKISAIAIDNDGASSESSTNIKVVDFTPPKGFTVAVSESEVVEQDGLLDIAFGSNGEFVYLRNQISDVACNRNAFGSDPVPGFLKKCYVSKVPDYTPPAGYTLNVSENETVVIDGMLDIAFGVNGKFVYLLNQSTDVTCNSAEFGSDPERGVQKKCFTKPSVISSVNNKGNVESIQVFPNPSLDGRFTLSTNSEWEVVNLNGTLISSGETEVINLENQSSGVYYLKVSGHVIKLVRE